MQLKALVLTNCCSNSFRCAPKEWLCLPILERIKIHTTAKKPCSYIKDYLAKEFGTIVINQSLRKSVNSWLPSRILIIYKTRSILGDMIMTTFIYIFVQCWVLFSEPLVFKCFDALYQTREKNRTQNV